MAEQTVKQQLVGALGDIFQEFNPKHLDSVSGTTVGSNAKATLDRARAEPEEHCNHDGPNCPTWAAGHQEGLEAQRERVGGGTA